MFFGILVVLAIATVGSFLVLMLWAADSVLDGDTDVRPGTPALVFFACGGLSLTLYLMNQPITSEMVILAIVAGVVAFLGSVGVLMLW